MAIPEQELKFFDFSGGMNTELGLVNTDEKALKNLENVELKPDGSAERRSGLSLFESDLIDSDPLNVTSQRSSTGWVYPAPSVFFWKTTGDDNKPKTYMIVANTEEDAFSNPTFVIKELSAGISDIENWSAAKGDLIENSSAVNDTFSPNFKMRFTSGGDFVIVTSAATTPTVFFNKVGIATATLRVLVRDPDSITIDSLVKHNSISYICIKTHTSMAQNEPGVGDTWRQHWREVGGAGTEPTWGLTADYTTNVALLWQVLFGDDFGSDEQRMTHSVFIGGRAWYTGVTAAPSTLYITQPLTDKIDSVENMHELGFCFSVNDPRSTTDSTATAADGGTINIREAGIIQSIVEFREGIIVFATNGVWSVPNAGNFNATSFDVLKISDIPIAGPDAFTETDFGVVYFGKNAVQLISITDNGNLVSQELSTPIKTFYNSISEFSKASSCAVYNKLQQRIYWFTTFVEPTFESGEGPYQTVNFNGNAVAAQDILVFDFKLKGWYKYQIRKDQDLVDADLVIADAATLVGDFGEIPNVINLAGDNVINAASDNIVSSSFDGTNSQEFLIMLVTGKKTVSAGADVFRYGFAHFNGDVIQDFDNLPVADDALKSTFDSEILTQQYNFTDIGHAKQTPYIHTIFRRVESGILDEGGDDITGGGCLLQFRWNWSTGTKAGPQFGTVFQAYRPLRWNISYGDGSLPDIEVVLNRHKIRGRGRALQLRYSNDGNKRFHLLGYQMEVEATKKV